MHGVVQMYLARKKHLHSVEMQKTKQTAVSLYKHISKQSQVNDLLFYLTLCNLSVLLRSTLEQCTKAKYSFYTDSSLYSNSHLVNTMKGEQSIQFQT